VVEGIKVMPPAFGRGKISSSRTRVALSMGLESASPVDPGPAAESPSGGASTRGRGGTHRSKPSPSRRLPSSHPTMHFTLYCACNNACMSVHACACAVVRVR
jgi:hypothetical protein